MSPLPRIAKVVILLLHRHDGNIQTAPRLKPDANAWRLMGDRIANPFTNTIPHISRRALAPGSNGQP